MFYTHHSYKAVDGPLEGERYALADDHFINDGGHYRANVILPAGDGRRAMYARTIHGYDPYLSEQNYELGDGARTLRFVGWTL